MPIKPFLESYGLRFDFNNPVQFLLNERIIAPEHFVEGELVFGLPHVAWAISKVAAPDTTLQHLHKMRASRSDRFAVTRKGVCKPLNADLLIASREYGIDVLAFLALMSNPERYFCKERQSVVMVTCLDQEKDPHLFRSVWHEQTRKFFLYHLPKGRKVEFGLQTSVFIPA